MKKYRIKKKLRLIKRRKEILHKVILKMVGGENFDGR